MDMISGKKDSTSQMVSGTNFATNKTVKPNMLENVKNVPEKR